MKYYKLEYDAERPSTKTLTVPTLSKWGVAAKVKLHGEPIEGDLTVDGLSATQGVNGWKIVELESGATPSVRQLNVVLEQGGGGIEGELSGEKNLTIMNGRQKTFVVECFLSAIDGIPDEFTIKPTNVTMNATVSDGETTIATVPADTLFITPIDNTSWHIEDGNWVSGNGDVSQTLDIVVP